MQVQNKACVIVVVVMNVLPVIAGKQVLMQETEVLAREAKGRKEADVAAAAAADVAVAVEIAAALVVVEIVLVVVETVRQVVEIVLVAAVREKNRSQFQGGKAG